MSELLTGLTGHVLQSPGFLWLWLLIPIAAWWRLRRSRPSLLFGSGRFLASDSPSGRQPRSLRQRLLVLPTLLRAAGLFFGLLALARPVSLVREPDTAEGIEIVLCLDVSSSMTATDLDGRRSRLALAKAAAISFVRGREHDRIGLVTFARFPDLRSPLTRDREALIELLADVNTVEADGPEDATGIGTAVTRAAQLLGR
ncbi:MAG: VWA domain-containing protein, partial [Planctomycetes bacterium]|nr:VWA domain-containing protein [Planctomycetota bacterium]